MHLYLLVNTSDVRKIRYGLSLFLQQDYIRCFYYIFIKRIFCYYLNISKDDSLQFYIHRTLIMVQLKE